ncbi:galactose-specific lectin nattectin-like [Saccostrea cucullata]|uniref:galactose-specific lectin nattectin-like n=1 Tax=Saccostrea cuccullata TaxID=36930 RepID=UPI002ED325DD
MAEILAVIFLLSQLQISVSQSLDTRIGDGKCAQGGLEDSMLSLKMYIDSQLQELEQKDCPKGWDKHGTSCYMLNTQKFSWEQANAKCRGFSAMLVEIDTMPENVFVANTLKNKDPSGRAWLGGTDKTQENTWIWKHSGLPLRFTNWNKGEPNDDKENEDCMEILSRNGMWNDMPCSYLSMFVCEKEF